MLILFSGITIKFTDPLSWLFVESYHDVSFVEIALGEIFDLVDHDLHSLLVSAVVLSVLTNKDIEYFKSMCGFCLCLCLWFLDIVPASMFGCVVIDSWTLYLPACVVVKVADACHAALCVFHHLGKLLINIWWPSLIFLAFSSVLLTFLLQTNWLLTDHKLANWLLTIWTFDFDPPQSDKSWLHGCQVLSPRGSRGYHLWPGREIIFESKWVKKVSFVQTKFQLCKS